MSKKVKELAIHDKDTGSSEVQIALLTEKIDLWPLITSCTKSQKFSGFILNGSLSNLRFFIILLSLLASCLLSKVIK